MADSTGGGEATNALEPLRFAPFSSEIEVAFFSSFFSMKLDHDKLSESARPLVCQYQPHPGVHKDDSVKMEVLGNALTASQVPKSTARADGYIRNVNTLDTLKNFDRDQILSNAGRQIWDAIKDGSIYSVPSLLASFVVLSYADLKKYRMSYIFGFPALHSDPTWKRSGEIGHLTPAESTSLVDEVGTWRYTVDSRECGFFLVKKLGGDTTKKLGDKVATEVDDDEATDNSGLDFKWKVAPLRDFETGFFDDVPEADRFVAFVDPSTYESNPAWPLRNLLVLVRQRFHLTKVQILCYRETHSKRHEANSIIMSLVSDPVKDLETSIMPKVTGWERNATGKIGLRTVSLAESLDPLRIAEQSVDLNLKLMKWRISPGLDLDIIRGTKCLLLGAGTLGSNVSRNLMGWGVRKITFVDYGAVSYSNPVRQSLFTFNHCLNGGAPKATRAAETLREIFPGVDSTGEVLSVPMLGHSITKKTRDDFDKLTQLIDEHDAIFLLMDSRESRWLPTVMGKAAGKIVINAALGFDSWVVMRHGQEPLKEGEEALGCYFCNDVVAPGDKDLTLDQQCTVTRPGVAYVASAMAVELLASLLQHPLAGHAPAPKPFPKHEGESGKSYELDPPDHALGLVPHQMRGSVGKFDNLIIKGVAYPHCSACSPPILNAFRSDGWEFLKRALEEEDYVSELSGLAEVQRQAKAVADDLDWDEEGEGGDGDEEEVLI